MPLKVAREDEQVGISQNPTDHPSHVSCWKERWTEQDPTVLISQLGCVVKKLETASIMASLHIIWLNFFFFCTVLNCLGYFIKTQDFTKLLQY